MQAIGLEPGESLAVVLTPLSKFGSAMFDERAVVKFGHCLAELFRRIHDDWTGPGHRLFDGMARDEQKPNSLGSGLHRDFIATVKQN